jgi:hypothetical protein
MSSNKETVKRGVYERLMEAPCPLTDEERTRRAEASAQALANARLEGFEPTIEDLKANQLWIDGKLTTEDLVKLHKERFRAGPSRG